MLPISNIKHIDMLGLTSKQVIHIETHISYGYMDLTHKKLGFEF